MPLHGWGAGVDSTTLIRDRGVRQNLWEVIWETLGSRKHPDINITVRQHPHAWQSTSRADNAGPCQLRVCEEWGALLSEIAGESGGRLQAASTHQQYSSLSVGATISPLLIQGYGLWTVVLENLIFLKNSNHQTIEGQQTIEARQECVSLYTSKVTAFSNSGCVLIVVEFEIFIICSYQFFK